MCLWGFFPIVFPLKWSLKIHWGFSCSYNSVSRFLLLWDLLLCVFYFKSISGVNRCTLFCEAAPMQPDMPNQIFWECIPCTSFLPYLQVSARVSFPLLPTVILFVGARGRTESEPWPPALGSLSSHTVSCWPALSHAWHEGLPHGGKKASQQSQISLLQVW